MVKKNENVQNEQSVQNEQVDVQKDQLLDSLIEKNIERLEGGRVVAECTCDTGPDCTKPPK